MQITQSRAVIPRSSYLLSKVLLPDHVSKPRMHFPAGRKLFATQNPVSFRRLMAWSYDTRCIPFEICLTSVPAGHRVRRTRAAILRKLFECRVRNSKLFFLISMEEMRSELRCDLFCVWCELFYFVEWIYWRFKKVLPNLARWVFLNCHFKL